MDYNHLDYIKKNWRKGGPEKKLKLSEFFVRFLCLVSSKVLENRGRMIKDLYFIFGL
jgi:hypothetical protein